MTPSIPPNSSPHELRTSLAEIDAETTALHARLRQLAAQRKPLVEALRGVIYPAVADLPAEIIIEIFLRYFHHARIGGQEPLLAAAAKNLPDWVHACGPLLLASVCRKWRDIALALKPLWSTFYVVTPETAMDSVQKLLECWLPRAGDHRLNVSLFSSQTWVLGHLGPYLEQLGLLHLRLHIQTSFPNETLQGKIPHLRSLHLSSNSNGLEALAVPITAFSEAPQLRALTLSNFPAQSIMLPWTQLVWLEIQGVFPDQCLDVLRNTTALERLAVDLIDSEVAPGPAGLRLPNLHTLKLGKYQQSLILLDELTLPVLTHIQFCLLEPPPLPDPLPAVFDNVPRFKGLVERSECALRSIKVYAPSAEYVLACLRAAGPTVTTVHLEDVEWPDYMLAHFLHALRDEEKLLPNLSTLSLNPYTLAVEVPYKDVAEMISGRRGKLESFELLVAENHRIDTIRPKVGELDEGLDALYALETEGVKLNLRTLQKLSGPIDSIMVYPPLPPVDL
ncbi:hypothetical protein FB45DRAFT_902119 [Roridomyces roridus]|uniref:F-box domain-containing protein n=1 Tax=Roridomyces roridus TaxID=1738132 RepID=A0AAD7FWA0_9AGAR|nr:hypothetical protein FB45DRAFT_902119 [Roridomyces roridus]